MAQNDKFKISGSMPDDVCKMLSPETMVSATTVFSVLCILILYRPIFIMKSDKHSGKQSVCLKKLVIWVVMTIVIVHYNEKLKYFYDVLISPICAAIMKACGNLF